MDRSIVSKSRVFTPEINQKHLSANFGRLIIPETSGIFDLKSFYKRFPIMEELKPFLVELLSKEYKPISVGLGMSRLLVVSGIYSQILQENDPDNFFENIHQVFKTFEDTLDLSQLCLSGATVQAAFWVDETKKETLVLRFFKSKTTTESGESVDVIRVKHDTYRVGDVWCLGWANVFITRHIVPSTNEEVV